MRTIITYFTMICALFASVFGTCAADEAIEYRSVQFQKGASSATLQGSLVGSKIVDYKLRAKGGQTMTVKLKSSNLSNYFNVLPPGSDNVAIFIGSTSGNDWTGLLPADGNYTIRVYLMRSAARRSEAAEYALTVGITGSGSVEQAVAPDQAHDVKVKGTQYHATGQIPCSLGDAPLGAMQCDFGVIRSKPGKAQVHVTPPGGFERVLTFLGKKVTSGDESKVKAQKSNDLWLIDVNDYEHYRIPDAVITGG